MIILKYNDETEKQTIINEQTAKGLQLVAISNVTEGNFLGFDDRNALPPVSPNPTMEKLQANQLTLMDAIATMYEGLLAKGSI